MTYEIGSKGSIVTEQFGKELSVFYRDGQGLLMTHLCNAGNQPRLRLRENGRPGIFEFEMFDITNLQSADADHVRQKRGLALRCALARFAKAGLRSLVHDWFNTDEVQ